MIDKRTTIHRLAYNICLFHSTFDYLEGKKYKEVEKYKYYLQIIRANLYNLCLLKGHYYYAEKYEINKFRWIESI